MGLQFLSMLQWSHNTPQQEGKWRKNWRHFFQRNFCDNGISSGLAFKKRSIHSRFHCSEIRRGQMMWSVSHTEVNKPEPFSVCVCFKHESSPSLFSIGMLTLSRIPVRYSRCHLPAHTVGPVCCKLPVTFVSLFMQFLFVCLFWRGGGCTLLMHYSVPHSHLYSDS